MSDLRFAFRQLLKSPGFSLIAVLTLALGVGACTAMFSTLDAVLLRSLPYPEADRLVQLHETLPDGSFNGVSGGVFLDWREHQGTLDSVALISPVTRNLIGDRGPERLDGLEATHEFLRVLGVQPILGRGFLPGEDRVGTGNPVALITEELWRSQFAVAESVVGSSLSLDGVTHTVVGVLPRGSLPRGIWGPGESSFVVPAPAERTAGGKFSRSEHWASVYGRLGSGVSWQRADADLKQLRRQLDADYPLYKRDWSAAVQPLHDRVIGSSRATLLILMASVAAVLLIACANVANLLLARTWNRRQEMAVRAALGASAGRIMRQVLTECLLLAAVAGLLGTALSVGAVRILGVLTGSFLPGGMSPRLDLRALGFALALILVTALAMGILPAWHARRTDLNAALKGGGRLSTSRGRHRSQALLVIFEVAVTMILLVGTVLLLRSLVNAVRADPGFQPRHVLALDLSLPPALYPTDKERFAFSEAAIARLRVLPGVEAAGTGMGIPFGGGAYGERVSLSGRPGTDNDPISRINYVSPGFLEALRIRLLSGRLLTEADDRTGAPRAIVVNDAVARRFFPEGDGLGRALSMLGQDWQIVGIVATVPDRRIDESSPLCLYVPHVYNASRFSLVVRTTEDPSRLANPIRQAIQELDDGLPLANIRTLDRALTDSLAPRRIVLGLIGSFGVVAVFLAGLGLYGVMAYTVTVQRRELAVRLALGAAGREVVGLVVKQGMRLAVAGIALGSLGALATGRWLQSSLFGLASHDLLTSSIVAVMLTFVTLLACWLPARRAARVDPMMVLRNE